MRTGRRSRSPAGRVYRCRGGWTPAALDFRFSFYPASAEDRRILAEAFPFPQDGASPDGDAAARGERLGLEGLEAVTVGFVGLGVRLVFRGLRRIGRRAESAAADESNEHCEARCVIRST